MRRANRCGDVLAAQLSARRRRPASALPACRRPNPACCRRSTSRRPRAGRAGREADRRRAGFAVERPSPTGSTIRAGSTCCPTATCWSPRPTRRPRRPTGLKDWAMKQVQKVAGAGVTSANRITLLRDADGDGSPETRSRLPAASCTRPSAWRWSAATSTSPTPTPCCASPTRRARPRSTAPASSSPTCRAARSTITGPRASWPSPDGTKLYVGVGSNSNVAENGIEAEEGRAAILEIDRATGRVAGLRVGAAQPGRHGLAAAVRCALGRRSTSATSSATTSCPTT